MSNRLLQALSLIGWLLQLLLLIGRMTECRRVAQVQNITPLIRANYKQVCEQRRQERWLSKRGASSFWGRGIVTWLNTRGGVSWSELTGFNKFCSCQSYKARLGGRQLNYNCNFCFHPNVVEGRFKVAQLLQQLNINIICMQWSWYPVLQPNCKPNLWFDVQYSTTDCQAASLALSITMLCFCHCWS